MALYDTKPISGFLKRENETRNRSLTFKNAFPRRETDQNVRKTPSRGGKWGKTLEKRLPAAGNGKNSQKNGFPRRERGKNARKTVSCGGKAVKFAGDRFPATGKGAFSPKNAFRRGNGVFYRAMFMSQKKDGPRCAAFCRRKGMPLHAALHHSFYHIHAAYRGGWTSFKAYARYVTPTRL